MSRSVFQSSVPKWESLNLINRRRYVFSRKFTVMSTVLSASMNRFIKCDYEVCSVELVGVQFCKCSVMQMVWNNVKFKMGF
jgi:hypothetical protein